MSPWSLDDPRFDALMDVLSRASIGDLAARVDVPPDAPDDALSTLSHALDVLLGDLEYRTAEKDAALRRMQETIVDLERTREELRRLNRTLEDRVEERTRALAEANRELEAFNFTVAHDLRAPLRGIESLTGFTLRDHREALPREAREQLEMVHRSARSMSDLVESLLRFSRTARGELRVQRDVDLSRMASDVAAELRAREPSRQVDVQVEPGLRVDADPGLLRLVLENLLGNAWKFTRHAPAPLVEVARADAREDERAFLVRDNGAGFDAARAHGAFLPFQRFHGPNEFQGTGVGLATVQRIVQRHGGTLRAESAPGKGATFVVTLPRRR